MNQNERKGEGAGDEKEFMKVLECRAWNEMDRTFSETMITHQLFELVIHNSMGTFMNEDEVFLGLFKYRPKILLHSCIKYKR